MYAFLHGKPNHYCSHAFEALSVGKTQRRFQDLLEKHWIKNEPCPACVDAQPEADYWPSASTFTHKDADYAYRPDVMEDFSLYFFCAGTKLVGTLHSDTWR